MKLTIKDIINKYKGQNCIVIGHGPSLNDYKDRLQEFKDKRYILIGCNNWSEFYPECPPHYWVNANTVDNSQNQIDLINKYKPIWVYADSVDLVDQQWLESKIETDYLTYDQRHFKGQECDSCKQFNCNKYLDANRLTIQEELQQYANYINHYDSGDTVALHSLAFGILMGCSNVYCIGLDFDYKIGYAKNNTNRPVTEPNYFDIENWGKRIFNDIDIIKKSADNVGTKLYNLNKNSYWKNFNLIEL